MRLAVSSSKSLVAFRYEDVAKMAFKEKCRFRIDLLIGQCYELRILRVCVCLKIKINVLPRYGIHHRKVGLENAENRRDSLLTVEHT